MPIYEYECQKCGDTFEAMQAISSKPLKKHDDNGCQGKVQRLVSASAFVLKGSGWYTSDYPSEARKKGWEQESKQAKGATEAPAADSSGDKAKASPEAKTPSEAKTETPAPAAKESKTSSSKNPYSSRKKSKAKSARRRSSK